MTYGPEAYATEAYAAPDISDTGGLNNIYQSDIGYTSFPGDTPANTHFPARVLQPFQYQRSLLSGGSIGGVVTQGFGDVLLNNADGSYDGVYEKNAIDGREIEVKIGSRDISFDSFGTVFKGSASGWQINERDLRVSLRDFSVLVDKTLQDIFYAGTGGLEGGSDLEDAAKPLTFGEAYNVTPVFVGIVDLGDGALRTYQTNARPIKGHLAVYEGGNEYTKISTGAPSGGEWKDHPDQGLFQIGSEPVEAITCDLEGDAGDTGGGYVSTTADVIQRILTEFNVNLTTADLNLGSFTQLNTDVPGAIGLFIQDKANASEVVSRILNGAGAYGGFTRNALFEVRALKAPGVSADLSIRKRDLNQPIEIVESASIAADLTAPVWRFRVGYRRAWTVQKGSILSGATEAFRSFAQREYRITEKTNSTTLQRHRLAGDPPFLPSLFANKSDADALADRLLGLFSGEFRFYRLKAYVDYTQVDVGDTVNLTYDRFQLGGGKNTIVVDLQIDAASRITSYTVFKP